MHTLVNDLKPCMENVRMEIAHPGKQQKNHALEMTENVQFEFARMENAHPGKCQNGNCTPWKITEKSHHGK